MLQTKTVFCFKAINIFYMLDYDSKYYNSNKYFTKLLYRSRRRSGSSIIVIDGDDLKPCLPDDYIHIHQQKYSEDKDFDKDMLKMLNINQGNGKFFSTPLIM